MRRGFLCFVLTLYLGFAIAAPKCNEQYATNYDSQCGVPSFNADPANECGADSCTWAIIRQNEAVWSTMSAECQDKLGYDNTKVGTPSGLRKCYTEIYSGTPPWSRTQEALGACTAANNCFKKMSVTLKSLSVDTAVWDDRASKMSFKLSWSEEHEDRRLFGLNIAQPEQTYRLQPLLKAAVKSQDTLEGVYYYTTAATSSQEIDLTSGSSYNAGADSFDVETSNVHCLDIAHCSVSTYGSIQQDHVIPNNVYKKFPFDSHTFQLIFTIKNPYTLTYPPNKQADYGITAQNDYGMEFNKFDTDAMTALEKSLDTLKISGHKFTYTHRFSTGSRLNTAGMATVEIKLMRRYDKFLHRFVYPLVFIVLVATSMPFLPPMQSGPRNQVGVIAMLTAVAFSNAAASTVPVTTSSTWFDSLNIVSIIMPFLVIVENISVQGILSFKLDREAQIMDQVARVIFPSVYLLYFFGSMVSVTDDDHHDDLRQTYIIMLVLVSIISACAFTFQMYRIYTVVVTEAERKEQEIVDKKIEIGLAESEGDPGSVAPLEQAIAPGVDVPLSDVSTDGLRQRPSAAAPDMNVTVEVASDPEFSKA